MQFLPDLRLANFSATYFVQLFSGAFWLSVLGGMVGAVLVVWLTKTPRLEPFAVNFRIDFWEILIGMKLITEKEFAEYNGASTGINRLDPARKIICEGIEAVFMGSGYRNGCHLLVYWPQFHEYSHNFSFRKRLEMIPPNETLRPYYPFLFIDQTRNGYEIGISLATEWWDLHKDDPQVAAFVVGVSRGNFVTDLVLAFVPPALIGLYCSMNSWRWGRIFARVDRHVKKLGWTPEPRKNDERASYSRNFFTVTLAPLQTGVYRDLFAPFVLLQQPTDDGGKSS